MIALQCDVPTRLTLRLVSRALAALAHRAHTDWLTVPATASGEAIRAGACTFRNVRIDVSDGIAQWCAFASATQVRRLHMSLGYAMPRTQPMQFTDRPIACNAALPHQLCELGLRAACELSEFVLSSITQSLQSAHQLQTVCLSGLLWTDAAHLVNALTMRARNPYNRWLTRFELSVIDADTITRPAPHAIDPMALALVEHYAVECGATNSRAGEFLAGLTDAFVAVSRVPLRVFVYTGRPLTAPRLWAHVVYKSSATLQTLVMPEFRAESLLEPESAVDAAHALTWLAVRAPTARLDFMLRNKPMLHTLYHYGTVHSSEQLLWQLAAMRAVRECHIAAPLDTAFLCGMHDQVRWPACTRLHVGGTCLDTLETVLHSVTQ